MSAASGSPVVALSRAPAAATFHLRTRAPPGERCAAGSSPVRCLAPRPWTGEVLNPPGLRWTVATAGRNAGGRAYAEASRGTGLRTWPTRGWLPAPAPVLRGPTTWIGPLRMRAAAGAAPRSHLKTPPETPLIRARMTRSSHGVWGAGIDIFEDVRSLLGEPPPCGEVESGERSETLSGGGAFPKCPGPHPACRFGRAPSPRTPAYGWRMPQDGAQPPPCGEVESRATRAARLTRAGGRR